MKALPGINIQFPISRAILSGKKTVETRTYPLPEKYVGKPLYFVETPGADGDFDARIVAVIVFGESFPYKSKSEFSRDEPRHLVSNDSPYAWKDRPKWGWPVASVSLLRAPRQAPRKRGIVFTRQLRPI